MASDTLILERLAAVTNLLNEIQANAKRTEEFPEQDPINASSKVRISLAGISYWVTLQQITELVNSIGFNAISFGSGVVDETAGDNTTIEEITDFINDVGFTVSASLILQLSIVVKKTVNGLACFYVKKYNFRRNNIIGEWGTGSDNGEIFENDLLETGEIFLAVIPSGEDDVLFDLGNIGSSTIYDYINATESTSEPWRELLDDGSVYYFLCLINDSEQLYRYDGTLPKTIGLGETEVFFSDFDLIGTTGGGGGGETEPITFKYEQITGGAIYQSLTATPSIELNLNSFFYRYITTDDDLEITFSNLPAPDYGFPRFIDLVIPATKVLTIPSADEIIGSVVADGTTVNRIELRFVYYPTVGLRIVAVINGGASSGGAFIPLSGTEVGSPVTGDIEIEDTGGLGFTQNVISDDVINKVSFNIDEGIVISTEETVSNRKGSLLTTIGASRMRYEDDDGFMEISTSQSTSAGINSNRDNFQGLLGGAYYGANYNDNTYVQKKYVDDTKHTGKSLYNATTTGTVNLDCATFDSWYRILTGNTDFTFTNTPASGETFVKTLEIITTAGETLDFPTADKVIGTFVNDDTTVNIITINFANYPTVGLRITVMINS